MPDQTHDHPPVAEETPAEETLAEAEASEESAATSEEPLAEEAVEAAAEERASGEGMAAAPQADPETAAEPEAVAEEATAAEAAVVEGAPKHWYIIHTYSGFEQKVADSLRSRAEAFGFAPQIGQILIPTEEVVELRAGKKVTSKRMLYPGYVLVEMEMNDELWHAVKATPRVTGFVGGGNMPVPLTADYLNSILYRQASSTDRPRPKLSFEKNENVRIVDGPFTNFSGKIDEVNTERNTLRVLVTIFGRATPVELDFLQVEKV
jgi:transcriptional antiterminator NusG